MSARPSAPSDAFIIEGKKNKNSALDVKRARGKEKAKAGNIPGSSNNHSSRAARAVRVAEESRVSERGNASEGGLEVG